MTTERFASSATHFIAAFGNAAHQAIGLYRDGGERLAGAVGARWDEAFRQASPQLSADTRRNARHAQQVFGRYYAQGLSISADGAKVVVDTLVGAAIAGVERLGARTGQA
jgi:hypothetical protein